MKMRLRNLVLFGILALVMVAGCTKPTVQTASVFEAQVHPHHVSGVLMKVTIRATDMAGGSYLLEGNPAIAGWIAGDGGTVGAAGPEHSWILYLYRDQMPCELRVLWVDGALIETCTVRVGVSWMTVPSLGAVSPTKGG